MYKYKYIKYKHKYLNLYNQIYGGDDCKLDANFIIDKTKEVLEICLKATKKNFNIFLMARLHPDKYAEPIKPIMQEIFQFFQNIQSKNKTQKIDLVLKIKEIFTDKDPINNPDDTLIEIKNFIDDANKSLNPPPPETSTFKQPPPPRTSTFKPPPPPRTYNRFDYKTRIIYIFNSLLTEKSSIDIISDMYIIFKDYLKDYLDILLKILIKIHLIIKNNLTDEKNRLLMIMRNATDFNSIIESLNIDLSDKNTLYVLIEFLLTYKFPSHPYYLIKLWDVIIKQINNNNLLQNLLKSYFDNLIRYASYGNDFYFFKLIQEIQKINLNKKIDDKIPLEYFLDGLNELPYNLICNETNIQKINYSTLDDDKDLIFEQTVNFFEYLLNCNFDYEMVLNKLTELKDSNKISVKLYDKLKDILTNKKITTKSVSILESIKKGDIYNITFDNLTPDVIKYILLDGNIEAFILFTSKFGENFKTKILSEFFNLIIENSIDESKITTWYHIFCDNDIKFDSTAYDIDHYKLLPLIKLMSIKPNIEHLTFLILSKKKFDDNGWKYYLKTDNNKKYVCRDRFCSLFDSLNAFGYSVLFIAAYTFNYKLIEIILKSNYKKPVFDNIKTNPSCGFIFGLKKELSRYLVSYTISRLTTNIRADIENTYNILKTHFREYFDQQFDYEPGQTMTSSQYIIQMNINNKLSKLGVKL